MKISAPRIRLVIFDWAGTIIDFGSCAPAAAFVELFAAHGVEVSVAEARGPMGTHKKEHLRLMLSQSAIAQRWRQRHGREWNQDDLERLYHELVPRQLETLERHSELVPGLLSCVEQLRRDGILIGGTTGYFQAASQRVLEAARRQGFVPDAQVCGDEVPAGRPAPWMIFRVMEQLQIYPAASVVKLGDTIVDIEEGLNAGCWSLAVICSSSEMGLSLAEYLALPDQVRAIRSNEIRHKFLEAGAHAVIDSLKELPQVIAGLNESLTSGKRP